MLPLMAALVLATGCEMELNGPANRSKNAANANGESTPAAIDSISQIARSLTISTQGLAIAGDCITLDLLSHTEDGTESALGVETILQVEDSGGGQFFSAVDSTCQGTAITTLVIGASQSRARVHFRDTHAETVHFSITDLNRSLAQGTAVLIVSPGTPAAILPYSGNNQSGAPNHSLNSPLVAVVLDAFNNSVPDVVVHWAVTSGTAALSSASNSTGSVGTSANTVTLGSSATSNTITASVSGISTPASFSATTLGGPATQLVLSSVPSSTTAGSDFTVLVNARDAQGNTASGYTGTVTITSNDGAAVLPTATTIANSAGSFSVTLKTAGSKTITASDGTLSVTSNRFCTHTSRGPSRGSPQF